MSVFVERPAKPAKVGVPLLKRWWLWAGAAAVLVVLISLFVFVLWETEAKQHYNAGIAFLEESQYELAILEFDKAIELEPNYAGYYVHRAWAYSWNNEYELSIADCNKALELEPLNNDAYHWRGIALISSIQHLAYSSKVPQELLYFYLLKIDLVSSRTKLVQQSKA